jgi:hypothetical protein
MEKKAVLLAQAMRFLRPSGSYGHIPAAVKALEEKFKFQAVPNKAEELANPTQTAPLVFRYGTCKVAGRAVVIVILQIFPTAVLAGVDTSTEDAESFLDELIEWASEKFGIEYQKLAEPAFSSQLEVKLAKPLGEYFPRLKKVCEAGSKLISDVFVNKPPYELAGITLSFDRLKFIPSPGNIRLERRESAPYADNLYFSEAPMTTKNHLALLKLLEDSLSA